MGMDFAEADNMVEECVLYIVYYVIPEENPVNIFLDFNAVILNTDKILRLRFWSLEDFCLQEYFCN